MEQIEKDLENIKQIDAPMGMHHSIMQIVFNKKMLPFFYFLFFIFVVNLCLIVWNINVKLLEVEFFEMMRDFLEVFNMSFSFVGNFIESFFDTISLELVLSLVFSFIGIVYLYKKIKKYSC